MNEQYQSMATNRTAQRPLVAELASRVQAYHTCVKEGNRYWAEKHAAVIKQLNDYLPSGSGIDSGSLLDIPLSSANKLVIITGFHHINENGMYDGWTEHSVIVTPGFHGPNIRVTGRNRNDIKDYLAEVFDNALASTTYSVI